MIFRILVGSICCMRGKWKFFLLLSLSFITAGACSEKTAEMVQAKEAAPVSMFVKVMESPVNQPDFEVKTVHAEWVNGFINIAITSKSGSMLQVNGIAEQQFKTASVAGDAFRLVYLPGGLVPACTSPTTDKNSLKLRELADKRWSLSLQGEVVCNANLLQFELQVQFDQPERSFVAPNH